MRLNSESSDSKIYMRHFSASVSDSPSLSIMTIFGSYDKICCQLCSLLTVFQVECWSFRYFNDRDLRETQKLKQEIETKNMTILLIS